MPVQMAEYPPSIRSNTHEGPAYPIRGPASHHLALSILGTQLQETVQLAIALETRCAQSVDFLACDMLIYCAASAARELMAIQHSKAEWKERRGAGVRAGQGQGAPASHSTCTRSGTGCPAANTTANQPSTNRSPGTMAGAHTLMYSIGWPSRVSSPPQQSTWSVSMTIGGTLSIISIGTCCIRWV